MRDLMSNNCDFLAIGLPAIAAARANGAAVAHRPAQPIGDVRLPAALRPQGSGAQHRTAKGKRIGTSSSTGVQRSMGYMMTEYLIRRAGLKPCEMQFIPAGQNREAQGSALTSSTVDAIMGDEPFASELVAQGVDVRLADLYAPKQSNELMGGPIVHAALASRKLLTDIMQRNQGMFPNRLAWDAQAAATTERFFHSMADNPKESSLSFADYVRSTPAD